MRKNFKMFILFLFYLLLAFLFINSFILIIQNKDTIIAYVTKDYESTQATTTSINEDGTINITYFVDSLPITTSAKNISYQAYAKNVEISINYCKSNPNKVLIIDPALFLNLLLLIFLLLQNIDTSPFFDEITFKHKSWELKMCDFVNIEFTGYYWYKITYSYEKNGKKEVESVLSDSTLIEALIKNNYIDKVPIRIHKNKRAIDLEYINNIAKINKSLIQFI